MTKAKLCCFAMIGAIGFAGVTSISTVAAETKTVAGTLTESSKDYGNKKDKRAEFEKKMKAAEDKWNTLKQAQKDEVYILMMTEMDNESKILDKLVELGVLGKTDVDILKAFKLEKYNRLKESGEFPFSRGKSRK